ncbi:Rap1 GTPase-activating protein 1 [Balamuthia mandrillaris]
MYVHLSLSLKLTLTGIQSVIKVEFSRLTKIDPKIEQLASAKRKICLSLVPRDTNSESSSSSSSTKAKATGASSGVYRRAVTKLELKSSSTSTGSTSGRRSTGSKTPRSDRYDHKLISNNNDEEENYGSKAHSRSRGSTVSSSRKRREHSRSSITPSGGGEKEEGSSPKPERKLARSNSIGSHIAAQISKLSKPEATSPKMERAVIRKSTGSSISSSRKTSSSSSPTSSAFKEGNIHSTKSFSREPSEGNITPPPNGSDLSGCTSDVEPTSNVDDTSPGNNRKDQGTKEVKESKGKRTPKILRASTFDKLSRTIRKKADAIKAEMTGSGSNAEAKVAKNEEAAESTKNGNPLAKSTPTSRIPQHAQTIHQVSPVTVDPESESESESDRETSTTTSEATTPPTGHKRSRSISAMSNIFKIPSVSTSPTSFSQPQSPSSPSSSTTSPSSSSSSSPFKPLNSPSSNALAHQFTSRISPKGLSASSSSSSFFSATPSSPLSHSVPASAASSSPPSPSAASPLLTAPSNPKGAFVKKNSNPLLPLPKMALFNDFTSAWNKKAASSTTEDVVVAPEAAPAGDGDSLSAGDGGTRSRSRSFTVGGEPIVHASLTFAAVKRDLWKHFIRPRAPAPAEEEQKGNWLVTEKEGYLIETGAQPRTDSPVKPISNPRELNFQFEVSDIAWYTDYFYGKEHENYAGADTVLGPLVASLCRERAEDKKQVRLLLRSKKGDLRRCFPKSDFGGTIKRVALRDALALIDPLLAEAGEKLKLVKDPSFCQELLDFETKQVVKNFKIGVLYCKGDQTTEEEMFNNEHGSEQFENFLDVLGDRIELTGWPLYRAGLDVNGKTTGTHSVYTEWENFNIMFHVSTLLPYYPADAQQIERKRHLGNDILMIVFKDSDSTHPFDPACITSEFNHVFAVVSLAEQKDSSTTTTKRRNSVSYSMDGPSSKEKFERPKSPKRRSSSVKKGTRLLPEDDARYRLAIARKDEVPSFGPYLPSDASMRADEFREFLLFKLLNGEHAAYAAPVFADKIQRVRFELLKNMLETHLR